MSTPQVVGQLGFLQHRQGDIIRGRYEVLNHLGGGNFGSVYSVRDRVVGNLLACKEMHVLNNPDTPHDERASALDLFKREALTLATLRHPHIPAAYFEPEEGTWKVCPRCGLDYRDVDVCPVHGATLMPVEERFYLMMDYIDGATLEELAVEYMKQRGRPLPETECLDWTAQIASALRSLHMLGIVHRDVKPDNIKIRVGDRAAMLLDFGLTKKVEESGFYGTVRQSGTGRMGTPGYAPPDMAEQQSPEPRSDIYALGMTMLRLLTARDPQDADDLHELKTHPPRHFNARISPEVAKIIQTATAHRREDRYPNVDEFLNDLNELRPQATGTRGAPPFTFADGYRARNARDLARAVDLYPREALNYLMNGMFAEWLRTQGLAAPAATAENVVVRYDKQPKRALEMFRRSLYTGKVKHADVFPKLEVEPAILNLGAVPSGEKTTRKIRVRNQGGGLLWGRVDVEDPAPEGSSVFQILLPGLKVPTQWEGNDVELEVELDTNTVPLGGHTGALLFVTDDEQEVRLPVSYTVQPLELKAEPQALNFGDIPLGAKRTLSLLTRKQSEGGGEPRGVIYKGELRNVQTAERFQGEDPLDVTVDASLPQTVAKPYAGVLHLDTNGGRLHVPISYRIVMPPVRSLRLILGALLLGILGMGALRLAYGALDPAYAGQWLWQPGRGAKEFEVLLWGPALAGALLGILGGWRYAKKMPNTDEFAQTLLPFTGMIVGIAGSWAMAWAAHWSIWLFGDWILRSLVALLPGPALENSPFAPPIAWATVGGIVGLIWGIDRVLDAVGRRSIRPTLIVVGVLLFLGLIINAMLVTP